jgi:hypothetical protein
MDLEGAKEARISVTDLEGTGNLDLGDGFR